VEKSEMPNVLFKSARHLITDCLACVLVRLYPDAHLQA
jgi:hypothetical protein